MTHGISSDGSLVTNFLVLTSKLKHVSDVVFTYCNDTILMLPQGKPAQQSKCPRVEIHWSPVHNKKDKAVNLENFRSFECILNTVVKTIKCYDDTGSL